MRKPILQLRKTYGSDTPMGNRDMDLGEYCRLALEGKEEFYRGVIIQSPGYSFYAKAPAGPHWVMTLTGEEKYLRSLEEVKAFYSALPELEKKHLIGSKIESLLK
jgi:hypothetical protein